MMRRNHHHADGPGIAVLQAPPSTPNSNNIVATGDLLESPLLSTDYNVGHYQDHHQPQQQLQYLEYEPQPENSSTTVFSADYATVSITTSSAPNGNANNSTSAPTIPGLGKINPSNHSHAHTTRTQNNYTKRKTIRVPTYCCNGGLDTKFNPSPRQAHPPHLHNLLSPDEYTDAITTLNDKVKKSRAKSLDIALLATGPLIVPLAAWGARHAQQVKRKKRLIEEGVEEFNARMFEIGRSVRMVWNRHVEGSGGESFLTIEEICEGEKLTYVPTLGGRAESPLLASSGSGSNAVGSKGEDDSFL